MEKSIGQIVTSLENNIEGRCRYGEGDNSTMISILSMQVQQQVQNQFTAATILAIGEAANEFNEYMICLYGEVSLSFDEVF